MFVVVVCKYCWTNNKHNDVIDERREKKKRVILNLVWDALIFVFLLSKGINITQVCRRYWQCTDMKSLSGKCSLSLALSLARDNHYFLIQTTHPMRSHRNVLYSKHTTIFVSSTCPHHNWNETTFRCFWIFLLLTEWVSEWVSERENQAAYSAIIWRVLDMEML